MDNWHIWSINQQRYKKVNEFLEELDIIIDFVYPTVEKEHATKKGIKIKNVPVYNNYIFLKYLHSNEALHRISKCHWIRSYVGPCSAEEIKKVFEVNGGEYDDVMPNDYGLKIGMPVYLKSNGLLVCIQSIRGDRLTVSLEIFGRVKTFDCSVDEVVIGS